MASRLLGITKLLQGFRVNFHYRALLLTALRANTSEIVVFNPIGHGAFLLLSQISCLVLWLSLVKQRLELCIALVTSGAESLVFECGELLLELCVMLPLLVLYVVDKVNERVVVLEQWLVKGKLALDLSLLFTYVNVVFPWVFLVVVFSTVSFCHL